MAPSELLRAAVEHVVVSGHEGKSGAGLERVRLADGRAVVVKRLDPENDLSLVLTGGTVGREYLLWRSGGLDRLPPGVRHAVLDAWVEDGTTVIVMRDLGDSVLTWDDRLPHDRSLLVAERVAAMHRAYLRDPPADLAPLDRVLDVFAPHRVREPAVRDDDLMTQARRGWRIFAGTVRADVAGPVMVLLQDVRPLASALAEGPLTLVHGDLATVNMAFEGDDLVLLDWAMPTAGPGALDITRFVAGCAPVLGASREEVLSTWASAAGPAHDERSMRLSLLAGLLWLGWNKALDAAEHPDLVTRERERADLDWWVRQAHRTLESGAL